jgi:arylsulfatase A-like enzyme
MSALLEGSSSTVHDDDYVTALFHRNQAFLRQGRWKLTAISRPFTEDAFALYDIANDPGETQDLSQEAPAQRARMIELWREERVRLGITLPSDL